MEFYLVLLLSRFLTFTYCATTLENVMSINFHGSIYAIVLLFCLLNRTEVWIQFPKLIFVQTNALLGTQLIKKTVLTKFMR